MHAIKFCDCLRVTKYREAKCRLNQKKKTAIEHNRE